MLSDTWYPGWKAYVDGTEVEVHRVYGLLRGLFLGPGSHKVLFKYSPTSFYLGTGLFFAALVVVFLSFLLYYRTDR